MSTPVTRGELREEIDRLKHDSNQHLRETLAAFATKVDLEAFATKVDLEAFATKADLEAFATKADLEAFATKADLEAFATKADLEAFATKTDLEIWGGALLARIEQGERRLEATEQRLSTELARHAQAILEAMQSQISASHDRYADLPGRVSRLEATVFTPEQR